MAGLPWLVELNLRRGLMAGQYSMAPFFTRPVAAVLALTLWRSGALQQIIQYGAGRENVLETDQSQLWEPGRNDPAPENTPQYRPIEDDRPQSAPEQLGRPVETKQDRRYASEGSSLLHKLLTDVTDKIAGNAPNTEK